MRGKIRQKKKKKEKKNQFVQFPNFLCHFPAFFSKEKNQAEWKSKVIRKNIYQTKYYYYKFFLFYLYFKNDNNYKRY